MTLTTSSPISNVTSTNNAMTTANNTLNVTDVNGNLTGTTCWNDYCQDLEEYEQSLYDFIFPTWYEWIFIVVYGLTFIVGLIGNYLVCYVVWKNHNMRTVTNVFIVNLAVGDLLVILLCLPPTLVQDVSLTWFLGTTMCKILIFLMNVSVSVSVLTLSAIAVERWYAICHPLSFKSTLSRARTIIIVIWLVSAGVALPELIVAETIPFKFPAPFQSHLLTACSPNWDPLIQSIYQLVLAVAMYLIPVVLMGLTYTHVAYVLWKNEIPGAAETGRKLMIEAKGRNAEDKLQSRRKAAKMLITIVVVFTVCYLPVHVLNILRYFGALSKSGEHATVSQTLTSHWLPYLNSCLNPIIYNFMSAKFQKEFKLACYWCLRPCYKTEVRKRGEMFTMTFSNSNYSNCHTEEVTLTSFRD